MLLVLVHWDDADGAFGLALGDVGGDGLAGGCALGGGSFEGVFERVLDELTAVNFHGWQGAEVAGEVFGLEGGGFLGGFSFEELGGHGRYSDGSLTAKGLEGGAVDDFFAVFFGELEPHANHVAAVGRSDCAHAVGVAHLSDVLWVGEGFLGLFFKVTHRC